MNIVCDGDKWMDSWMDGYMDTWMNGWIIQKQNDNDTNPLNVFYSRQTM
jgi:hypothetical protein